MVEMSVVEQISLDIIVFLITSGIVAVGSFCGVIYRCNQKQNKRGYRQSQAILLLTKSIEEQTKKDHPDYNGTLYEDALITLKDEKGEL